MNKVIELIKVNDLGDYVENESMKYHTSMRVGGKVKLLFTPKDTDSVATFVRFANEHKIPYFIMGRGSNLIFPDYIQDLVVVKISKVLDFIEIDNTEIVVGAGYSLARLAKEVSKKGLQGLEFAGGIPGTVGGGIYMNAGAHTGDMSMVVKNVTVIDENGQTSTLSNKACKFEYRHSIFQNEKFVIISCVLELEQGDNAKVYKKMAGNLEYRKEMQPLELPSVGSIFRNPVGNHAGKLIEDAGLKGYKIGGAYVSEKHANFIVNVDDATADDVLQLVKFVQDTVFEKTGIQLNTEFIKVEINEK